MNTEQQAFIIIDLGFGDSGKGSLTDFLARKFNAHSVIRYNGGAQAGHNVVTPEGKHHTFSQFGSAAFKKGVETYLSRFMMVNPLDMVVEEKHLRFLGIKDAFQRTIVDKNALIITPFHKSINRLREISRGKDIHGSCGKGIGETMSDFLNFGEEVLFAGDLLNPGDTLRKLKFLQTVKQDALYDLKLPRSKNAEKEIALLNDPEVAEIILQKYLNFAKLLKITDENYLKNLLEKPGTVIFEGAQGMLLDEKYGFQPYTTWSNITASNALTLLNEAGYGGEITKLGILRAYLTKHGAGPFVTEDPQLSQLIPDPHNTIDDWQGNFRVGYFDFVAAKYAIEASGGIDALAITCLDRLEQFPQWKICESYDYLGNEANLEEYFDVSDGLIKAIKVKKPTNFKHQAKLAELLSESVPNYVTARSKDDVYSYLSRLGMKLRLPIEIVSFGPTADDKKYLVENLTVQKQPEKIIMLSDLDGISPDAKVMEEIEKILTPKDLLSVANFNYPEGILPSKYPDFNSLLKERNRIGMLELVPLKNDFEYVRYHAQKKNEMFKLIEGYLEKSPITLAPNIFPYDLPKDLNQYLIWLKDREVTRDELVEFIAKAMNRLKLGVDDVIIFERSALTKSELVRGTLPEFRHIHFWYRAC